MSDMEKEKFRQIGIDLINEYRQQRGLSPINFLPINTSEVCAFIRSIQLHEKTKEELQGVKQELADFRQEVSDAAEKQARDVHEIRCLCSRTHKVSFNTLSQFIIPAPKRDPMSEVWRELFEKEYNYYEFIAAMDARGLEIREKNDD